MAHVLKYKVGEKVKIIGDQFCSHGEDIGTESIIEAVEPESRKHHIPRNHQEYFLSCGSWVTESDIELVQ